MFLDDENSPRHARRNETRRGLYLAVIGLAACIMMIFGLMAQATAEAAEGRQQRLAGHLHSSDAGAPLSLSAEMPLAAAALPMEIAVPLTAEARLPEAERHILAGLILLAVAMMAGMAFAVWRGRMTSLVHAEAWRNGG